MSHEIFVNTLKRSERSRISEVDIRNKVIQTPTYFPKLKRDIDLRSIGMHFDQLENKLFGYCINLTDAKDIYQALNPPKTYQAELFDLHSVKREKEKLIQFSEQQISIIDPQTELFYYDWTIERGTTLKSKLLSLPSFPEEAKHIFMGGKGSAHNKVWKKIYKERYLFSVVRWFAYSQNAYNPDIINPCTPVIDGKDLGILNLAVAINEINANIVKDKMDALPSVYLPLHYNAIKKDGFLDLVLQKFEDLFLATRLITIKVVYFDYLQNSSIKNLSKFLSNIDSLKQEVQGNLISIYMDGLNEGYYTLSNGIDIYTEPLDGIIKPMRRKAKTEEEREIDEALGIKETGHGNYILKESREKISFSRLLKIVERNNGRLPCDCNFCKKYYNNLSYNTPISQWNQDRRLHLVNFRLDEIEKLKDYIDDGDMNAIRLRAKNDNNKNLVYLLPDENY